MRTASTTVLMLDVIVTKTLLCLYIHPLKITKISFSSGYNYFGWSNCINMKITSSCGKSFGNYHCSQQNQPERFSLLHQLSCLMDYHTHCVFNGLCSPMLVNPHFFFQEPCLLILLFLSLHYCQPIFICSQTLQYVRFFFSSLSSLSHSIVRKVHLYFSSSSSVFFSSDCDLVHYTHPRGTEQMHDLNILT